MRIFSEIRQIFSSFKKHPSLIKGTDVFWNGDFYYVESKVDQGTLGDPDGIHFYYDNTVENATLGSGVIECLNKCWDLEEGDFPLRPAEMARKNASLYPARLAEEMKRFGYKHNRARSQNMLKVIVRLKVGTITLEPTNHISLEHWTEEKMDPADHITVDSSVDSAEMGRLIKLAFERCKNKFNGSAPQKKSGSSPKTDDSKNAEQDVYEIALLCNGDMSAAKDVWLGKQKSSDDYMVFLGSELSKKGYCLSNNWKGALANFQDVFMNFVAGYGIQDIAFDEIEDAVYTSTDIVDCLLLVNTWLSKYGYKMMYLNELPDMCELVLIKSSDLERVDAFLKRAYGFEMESISALS